MTLLNVKLQSNPLSESHKVKSFAGQTNFYKGIWDINYSSQNDSFRSPFFSESEQSFQIFFILKFDNKGKATITGYLVQRGAFKSFYVYFIFGNPKAKNVSVNNNTPWTFSINDHSNNLQIEGLNKSEINTTNGMLDNNGNLNVYFEISYYQSAANRPRSQPIVHKIPGKVGLKNMNSMCYINSFLQILFHIPKFRHIIFSADVSEAVNKPILLKTQYLFYMMKNSDEACSAKELANEIELCKSEGNPGQQQQDASEFAMQFLNDLQKELKGTSQENAIEKLFYGNSKRITKCKNINFKTSNEEKFFSLILPVNDNNRLYDCLKECTQKSTLDYQTDQYGNQQSESWMQIEKLPPILQICIQRSYFNPILNIAIKKQVPLSFVSEFDFCEFTNDEDDEYILYAVLSHEGESDCGHFCVFIRDLSSPSDDTKWFKYNDSYVNEVPEKIAIDGNFGNGPKANPLMAYILYYVRESDIDDLFQFPKKQEIPDKIKEFLEKRKKEKELGVSRDNSINFRIILEENLNSKPSIEIDDKSMFLKGGIYKTQRTQKTFDLYVEISKFLNKDIHEIRLWAIDINNNNNFSIIRPSKQSSVGDMEDILFVQNKAKTDTLFPSVKVNGIVQSYRMIFLKYFDVRMKVPIRYIGSIIVDKNSGLDVPQINQKLGFPEWTKFYYFKEINSTTVKRISPDKTFSSAQMNQGSVLIVQVDYKATSLAKLILTTPIESDPSAKEKIRAVRSKEAQEEFEESLPNLLNSPVFKGVELIDPSQAQSNENSTNNANNTNNIDIKYSDNKISTDITANSKINNNNINVSNNDNISNTNSSIDIQSNVNNTINKESSINHININIPKKVEFETIAATSNRISSTSSNSCSIPPADPSVPHFKAIDILSDLSTDLLDLYLAVRFNTARLFVYDYESRASPKFTLDFPICLGYGDMCRVCRAKSGKDQSAAPVLLYKRDSLKSNASFSQIQDRQFEVLISSRTLPGSSIYFLYEPEVTSMSGKVVFTLQVAPDGYNVAFTKVLVAEMLSTPAGLLMKAAGLPGFPQDFDVNDVQKLRFLDVHESRIFQDLPPNEPLNDGTHPIRVCRIIPPDGDFVAVRVHQAVVGKQMGLSFVNEPFYLNVRNGMTVAEFKEKVRKNVRTLNVEEFMKTRLQKMVSDDCRSSGRYWSEPDEKIEGLKTGSVIYVIYDQ